MPRTRGSRASDGKGKEKEAVAEEGVAEQVNPGPVEESASTDAQDASSSAEPQRSDKRMTMEERQAKMKDLRERMERSARANRKAVASESSQHRKASGSGRPNDIKARKLERAERILDEHDAQERGEDYERTRSWAYTIEDNERWEEKLEQKEAKRDQGYIDPISASERTYRRLTSQIKPDMKAYAEQQALEAASSSGHSSQQQQLIKHDGPSVGQHDLRYGTHKPDDGALDRVAAHLNAEADVRAKRSRYRPDDPDGEVNYINDKNKHYNKKIKRYYDKYTTTIRENFERGTAL